MTGPATDQPAEGGGCACLWCGSFFDAGRRRGSPRRFCSAACRHAYRTAAARWAIGAIEAALITTETLKAYQRSARAFGEVFQQKPKPTDLALTDRGEP